MLRRSGWSCAALGAAVVSVGFGVTVLTRAQDVPATAPATVAALDDAKLKSLADDFMYYSLVNNNEMAKADGETLVQSGASPKNVMMAFDAAADGRNPRDIFQQNQHREDLKDVSMKLLEIYNQGYRMVARDPLRIRDEIDHMGNGPRAFANAKERLTAAGQFAAPIFLEYLQNAGKKDIQPYILQIMGEPEMGRPLLLPLIEELRTPDPNLRIELVEVIGKIGYPQALPALRQLQQQDSTTGELKRAVDEAIAAIDRTGTASKMPASDLYMRAAENYYNAKASYQPLLRDEKTNPIWVFDPGLGNVQAVNEPTVIWNSVMTIRQTEAALRGDANNSQAISLWLAATLRREIQLPEGATDPLRDPSAPDGAFYACAAGPVYVNPVLGRALDDHDPALALKAIEAIEHTGSVASVTSQENGAPLVRAMSYPDRAVRYKAAFALARANPTSAFPAYFRVIPILCEAVNSSGTPSALVISSDEDTRNLVADTLHGGAGHFITYPGTSIATALNQARSAPAIDAVIVTDPENVTNINQLARTEYRLAGVPILIATPAAGLANMRVHFTNIQGVRVVDIKADDDTLRSALAEARGELGSAPLDDAKAKEYASTALDLLGMLAADHRSIYPMSEAIPTLIEALRDKRSEIATAAGQVAGKLNSVECEKALADMAAPADADATLRAGFYADLAESAKHTGNQLDAAQISALINTVLTEADPKVRLTAATALGALNVPSNQASTLILKQAK